MWDMYNKKYLILKVFYQCWCIVCPMSQQFGEKFLNGPGVRLDLNKVPVMVDGIDSQTGLM